MPASGRKINLLPPSEFEISFWGKLLKWAVTTGRYIIILTELIVIIAFLSRFKLDNDISNLNSEIEGKRNVLQASSNLEKEFRLVQRKSDNISTILADRILHMELLNDIEKNTPDEVKFDSITISDHEIKIDAQTNSEKALGTMLSTLNKNNRWKNVELSGLNSDQQNGLTFLLTIKI